MVQLETVFNARTGLSPNFAAEISNCAARYQSTVTLKYEDRQLRLGSLISILSLDLRRGAKLTVIAEGSDEAEAAGAMRDLLQG